MIELLLRRYIPIIIFIFLSLGFISLSIDPHIANKAITIAGLLSLALVSFNVRYYLLLSKGMKCFFLSLLFLGCLNLLWYGYFKTPEAIYKNAYRGYLEAGKMLFFSAFILLVITKREIFSSYNYFLIPALTGHIILLIRAFYQGAYLNIDRIPLSAMDAVPGTMGAATIAAYMITFSSLYALLTLLKSNLKYRLPLFFIIFILSFSAVTMTGTRSAIFTLPLITAIALIFSYKDKRKVIKIIPVFVILVLACGLLFNKAITSRVNLAYKDVELYKKGKASTSIGARFAMLECGFLVTEKDLTWQSLEDRGRKIKQLSQENKIFNSVSAYLDVHMHNEWIEALSTKGIIGIIILVFFYISLAYYSFSEKEPLILTFLIAMLLFGISDVIMHAKPIPSSWLTTLLLFCSLISERRNRTI